MCQNSRDISVAEAAEFFTQNNCFTVYCHSDPDGDTLGSAVALCLALRRLEKECHVFVCSRIPDKLSFIDKGVCIDGVRKGFDVSVDIASAPMLGKYREQLDFQFDLSIDHHSINTIPCRKRLLKSDYIACGEIIYELITQLDVDIDADIASALYAAISSDSGCFKYSGTRPQTHITAARLIETGIDFAYINRCLFEKKTLLQLQLEKEALQRLKLYLGGKFAVIELPRDVMDAVNADESDMDALKQLPRQIAGVEVAAFIRHYDGVTKVSLRSNDYFNVAEFARKHFGGGGHIHAAAFRIFEKDDSDTGLMLAAKLKELLK